VRVVDAGVLVGVLVGDLQQDALGDEELAAPHLVDSEVTQVLRRLAHQGNLTDYAATAAMDGFVRLSLTRYPADWLRGRIWALRHNLSAYDATYVALTERLSATSLLTTDARLAAAPGLQCAVDVL
jgi:predicted nucleic acid-binding protein